MESGSAARPSADAIWVDGVTVYPDRLELSVRVASESLCRTTPELVGQVQETHPFICEHACRNAKGPVFGAVAADTSLAHLLEHLVIDIQIRDAETDGAREAVFTGTTEPDPTCPDDPCRARVRVSMRSDVAAMRAVTEALGLLNGLLAVPAPDSIKADCPDGT